MSDHTREPRKVVRLDFDGDFDPRAQAEAQARGYRSHVRAVLGDGTQRSLTFYEPTRLLQTLADEARAGRPWFSEPGLIVVSDVTLEIMTAAATELFGAGTLT